MSEQAEGTEPQPEKKKGGALVAIVALVALLAGGGAGAFVIAPKFLLKPTPEQLAKAAEELAQKKKEEEAKPGKIVRVDNLVVNPAGSDGSSYLMTSVAFEVGDSAEAKLKAREVQLRDELMAVLAALPMQQLTQAGARDSLKARLAAVVAPIVGPEERVRVYLPQFVIQ